MRLRRALASGWSLAVLVVCGSLLPVVPAVATELPDFETPFPCAEQWTGTSRAAHRPSPNAVDFNRAGDLGAILVATAPGVVSRVQDSGGASYGKWVQVDHGGGWSSLYAHLQVQWVVPGQRVDQGTALGLVGSSGGVTGAHLHFEERYGSTVQRPVFHGVPFGFGSTIASANCPDVPLAGDWDGDGAAEVAVFHRDPRVGSFELSAPDGTTTLVPFGRSSDTPVSGDWDGDGRTEVGVRRQRARLFLLRQADGTTTRVRYARIKDVPVTGDWDGDGVTDVGVWRPGSARFRLLLPDGTERVVALGTRSSQPVTGDWNGDGLGDLGVFDAGAGTFTLRTSSPSGSASVTTVRFGVATDLPVTGDWNGDGVTDLGTWAPATATYTLRTTPPPTRLRARVVTQAFGRPR
ncbi:MAG TPA: VCBS repeat domain-containing M23 family metallopeptidase [Nocardioidaceae bacterium]|nr:VCBS repeat domain-containing M23 family metallopeptidase [Nocardioidaceae bacterium]